MLVTEMFLDTFIGNAGRDCSWGCRANEKKKKSGVAIATAASALCKSRIKVIGLHVEASPPFAGFGCHDNAIPESSALFLCGHVPQSASPLSN